MSNKILSIDSGGTKTLGIIYDEKGQVLKELTVGQSNFAVDYDKALLSIDELIKTMTNEVEVDLVVLGAAGYSRIPDVAKFEQELTKKYGTVVKVVPDAYLGLYSNYDPSMPFIYSVAGTGSITYAIDQNKVHRFGGFGHIFGDYGSAYGVSINLLEDALMRFDEGKNPNSVQKKVLKQFKLKTREQIIGFAHKETKVTIASLAKYIDLENAKPYVQKLYKNQAKAIVSSIEKAIKVLKINQTVKLVLRGGFIQNATGLKAIVLDLLKTKHINFIYEEGTHEPVYGGFVLG